MLTNTDSLSSVDEANVDLRLEVVRLEAEVEKLSGQLRRVLQVADDVDLNDFDLDAIERSQKRSNPYVFDVDDAGAAAFDNFFNTYDPHLEKTRSFLLD